MATRRALRLGLEILVLAVALSLIAGHMLGHPLLLAFVETGSMEPTLDPGDGFIAVPTQLAGPVERGDVVVFKAEEVQGGKLTTHRVVGETDRGYITKGDSNPFTDQDSGEPPVKRAQVVAVALQLGGEVVVIPSLGTVVEAVRAVLATIQRQLAILLGTRSLLGIQGLAYLFFAVTLIWYAIGAWRERAGNSRDRTSDRNRGTDVRVIVGMLALLLVVTATLSMVGPAGSYEFGVVSAEFDSPGPRVIPKGEAETGTFPVPNSGFLPTVAYLEPASEGITIQPREVYVPAQSTANATVTLHAPPQTGYYRRYLVEHRYLAILPQSTIRALYNFHPWAPIVAIDALIGILFYLIGVRLVGTGRLRSRSRDKPSRLRRLYSRLT